jgi:hypothetical protein
MQITSLPTEDYGFVVYDNSKLVGSHFNHLCGYVHIPKGHPYHEVDYFDSCVSSLKVQGGITYSGHLLGDGNGWFIGFDCNHWGDTRETYDEDYVLGELLELRKQLREIAANQQPVTPPTNP